MQNLKPKPNEILKSSVSYCWQYRNDLETLLLMQNITLGLFTCKQKVSRTTQNCDTPIHLGYHNFQSSFYFPMFHRCYTCWTKTDSLWSAIKLISIMNNYWINDHGTERCKICIIFAPNSILKIQIYACLVWLSSTLGVVLSSRVMQRHFLFVK